MACKRIVVYFIKLLAILYMDADKQPRVNQYVQRSQKIAS